MDTWPKVDVTCVKSLRLLLCGACPQSTHTTVKARFGPWLLHERLLMGGVLREQKMLKGHLPRVTYHRVYEEKPCELFPLRSKVGCSVAPFRTIFESLHRDAMFILIRKYKRRWGACKGKSFAVQACPSELVLSPCSVLAVQESNSLSPCRW